MNLSEAQESVMQVMMTAVSSEPLCKQYEQTVILRFIGWTFKINRD